jgi:hypothetical protein
VAEHVVAQHHVGELGGQPGEGGPALEEALGLLGVEAVEVVGDPHRVEVGRACGRMCSSWYITIGWKSLPA